MSKKSDKKKVSERQQKAEKVFGARWRERKGKMVLVWKKRKPEKYDPVVASETKKKGKKHD